MYSKGLIYNLAMTSNAVEYSQALQANTKKAVVRSRNGGDLKLALVSGETATVFFTIPAGGSYAIDAVFLRNPTLYLKSTINTDVAEILTYGDFAT